MQELAWIGDEFSSSLSSTPFYIVPETPRSTILGFPFLLQFAFVAAHIIVLLIYCLGDSKLTSGCAVVSISLYCYE